MTRRKIITIVSAITIALGLTGCISSNESVRDEMLEYMNEKYGKNFIGLSIERVGYNNSSDTLICYAEGEDRYEDYAYVYRDKIDGVVEYSDTYFGIIIRDDVRSELENIVKEFGYEAKAFPDDKTLIRSNKYDKTKTFEDLKLDKDEPGLLVAIAVTSDKGTFSEEDSEELFEEIRKNNMEGMFTFYYFNKENFEKINDETEGDLVLATNDDVIAYYYKSIH